MTDLLSLDTVLFQEEPRAYVHRGKAYRSVTDRLREAGMAEDFSMVPKDRLEYALTRGRYVHLACEFLDLKQGINWEIMDPTIEPFARAHERMLEELRPKVIAVEKPMVARFLNVGGRPDVIYWIGGKRCLVDRKSGNSRKRRDGKVQTAMYKLIWDYNHPKTLIEKRYIEKLYSNGTYQLIPCDDPLDMQAAIDVLRWGETNEKLNHWRKYYGFPTDDDQRARHEGNGEQRNNPLGVGKPISNPD